MTHSIVRTAVLAVVFSCCAAVALAQAPAASAPAGPNEAALDRAVAQIRKDAAADVNTLISASMRFSADENAKFWPLYKVYAQRRQPLADERLALIKDYAKNFTSMTDAKALELMQRTLALEDKMAAAKREFLAELGKNFPGKTVARFSQVHRRIDMLLDLTLASEIPLVQ